MTRTSVVLRVYFLIVIFVFCFFEFSYGQANDDLKPLKIGVTRYIGDAHNYIAADRGFFDENGLDARLVLSATGLESVRKVLRSEVDLAMITPTPLVFAGFDPNFFLGKPAPEYAIIANLMQSFSLNVVVVAADRGINVPADLEGKTIALKMKTGSEYYWYSYTIYHELDSNKVKLVDTNVNDMVKVFNSRAVDGFTIWEPLAKTIRNQVAIPTLELPEQHLYPDHRVVVTRRDFAVKNSELIERYLESLFKAEKILQNDPDEVAELMASRITTSIADIHYMQQKITFNITLDESLLLNLHEQAKWALETKYKGKKSLPEFRHLFYDGPLSAVMPSRVNYLK